MNPDPLFIPAVIFWILAALIIILPARWSVITYLLLVQIDLSAVGNFSTTSLGIENVIKVVVIPTILLLKVRQHVHVDQHIRKFAGVWLLLVGYACLATTWSEYRIPGIKMMGYLYAYCVLFLVFTVAWESKWFTANCLMFVVWISLLGAVIQTYGLGNAFGDDDFVWRFTTFSGAQSFAPFLLCLLVLLVFRERPTFLNVFTALGACFGLLLTGSRSIFLGLLWVLLMFGVWTMVRSAKKIATGMILKRVVIIGVAITLILIVVINLLPENRLNEMLSAAVEKDATIDDIGTFGWRFSLYQKTLAEISSRSVGRLMLGSGTSSGASLVLDEGFFSDANVDPNRALHDEFLRSLYEWGFIGLFALLYFLVWTFRLGFNMAIQDRSPQAWAFLAIFVPLLISLTVENFLADSGSPGGVGYNLIVSGMLATYCAMANKKEKSVERAANSFAPGIPNPIRAVPES